MTFRPQGQPWNVRVLEPDLAPSVRAALGTAPPRRPFRPILVTAAALAIAIAAAFAVPDSRSAILRLLGIEGAIVIEVDDLPKVGPGPLAFGERTSLPRAERLLGFHALLPDLGRPDAVYADERLGYLILLYDGRLRLSEFRPGGSSIEKLAGIGGAQRVQVDGDPGIFVRAGHVVFELGSQPRLAADSLLWSHGGLTLRLEAASRRPGRSRSPAPCAYHPFLGETGPPVATNMRSRWLP